MRAAAISFFLACSLGHAQTQVTTQTFHFQSTDGIVDMQSTVNALRSVLDLTQVAFDPGARTTTVQATPSDIALAEWLFGELEAPPVNSTQTLQIAQNPGPSGPGDRLFVYRLAHMNSVEMVNQLQGFQGIVNMVRVLPQLTKVFPRSGNFAIAARGSEDQLALATWLLQQLDQPISTPGTQAAQKFESNVAGTPDVRVLYFAHALSNPQQIPVVNAIRGLAELTRVFPVTGKGAVAVGGSPDRVAMAEWLFGLVDMGAPHSAYSVSPPYAYIAGTEAQVFYLPGSMSDAAFDATVNALKTAAPTLRLFANGPNRAVAACGTPAQLAQAAQSFGQTVGN